MKLFDGFIGRAPVVAAVAGMTAVSVAQAALISVNVGTAGSAIERGIAFNLTNNSATESVRLTGQFDVPLSGTSSETYSLWTRGGSVVGNIGVGATNWTDRGTANATAVNYVSPSFTLTTLNFTPAADIIIAPGATLGIWLKDSDRSASFRYVNGGSNTVSTSIGFDAGGSLTYTGHVGLGADGASPTQLNSTFGPTRNFIGRVGYEVLPIPEPAVVTMIGVAGVVSLLRRR